jgi:uncharacterized protein
VIRIRLTREAGAVKELWVSGHAGSAPKGEDIICSAVSVLVQTYYFSLVRLLKVDTEPDVRDGYFFLRLPDNLGTDIEEKAALLAESMLVGLEEINRSYPGFLEVTEE